MTVSVRSSPVSLPKGAKYFIEWRIEELLAQGAIEIVMVDFAHRLRPATAPLRLPMAFSQPSQRIGDTPSRLDAFAPKRSLRSAGERRGEAVKWEDLAASPSLKKLSQSTIGCYRPQPCGPRL